MDKKVINIVGIGYYHTDISAAGLNALRTSNAIVSNFEIDEDDIKKFSPKSIIIRLNAMPTFLEERSNVYKEAAKEIIDIVIKHRVIAIPILGNPYVIEGIANQLYSIQNCDFKINVFSGPSIIDKLLIAFPSLITGQGFRVWDTSKATFSTRLDPFVDTVLLQVCRVGSSRHTLGCIPNKTWFSKLFEFIQLTYPDSSHLSLITLGLENEIKTVNLNKANDLYEYLTNKTTIIIHSPFKEIEDTEIAVMSRLVTPLDIAIL
ncbi:hypothetical protein Xbed_00622 [Xenorhabdus beddingii]|uniref:Tetrapyrrole methylase domain-containing protein n=1 Tax=Xenorhabdus beddingii TaxID=40578 RepID=A0A1Y2SQW8_9GAMM|nr:hypothetical protein [Xenorhabdus beddingii]OTA21393.1 hypothetical protein Xbed_00622 [Xenorhabdus beddingii]